MLSSIFIGDDNLNALEFLLKNGYKSSVDLVYIDPPFATNNTFRVGGTLSVSRASNVAYSDKFSLEEYLAFMRKRLVLVREMMSEKGSIYVHIDTKMSHYLKVLMDEIFGIERFINEITRIKCNPKNFSRKGYGNIKDTILFYSKTKNYIFNEVFEEDLNAKERFKKCDEKGFYTTVPLHAPGEVISGESGKAWNGVEVPKGRHWRSSHDELNRLESEGLLEWSKNGVPRKKIYFDAQKGKKTQDIWEFKDPQNQIYPTQKNALMLRRILLASSNENSLVMDCFAGSGSFLKEAFSLGRRFVGVECGEEAVRLNLEWINDGLFSKCLTM